MRMVATCLPDDAAIVLEQNGLWQPELPIGWFNGYEVCRGKDIVRTRGTDLWEVEPGDLHVSFRFYARWSTVRLVRKLAWGREDLVDCAKKDASIARGPYRHQARKDLDRFMSERSWWGKAQIAAQLSLIAALSEDVRGKGTKDYARQQTWIEKRLGEKLM